MSALSCVSTDTSILTFCLRWSNSCSTREQKKNFKVDNLGPIAELDDVKEVYGKSKDYETEFGWISFTYEGEKRFLNYQYRNINTYEGLRYYEKLGAADMVKAETSILRIGYWAMR